MQFYADDKPITIIPVELNGKNIAHAIFASEKEKNNQMKSIEIKVDTKELDATIEKVNHLTELLKEAQQIIGSLCNQEKSET